MDEIAKKRAELKQDSREWSALDALEDMVFLIKEQKISPKKIAIHWFEENEDGSKSHHYQVAGVDFPDHIALLNIALNRVIEDWKL